MNGKWLPELWYYRELFYFLIWRDIKIRYKQTLLGAAWAVIQPFATMIVFTIFFGKLAKIPSDGIPYPIFSYSALLPWIYFSGALTNAGNSLVTNTNLITKVYFPRAIIPASSALSGLVDFAIASVLLFAMMLYYQIPLTWELLLWPVFIFPLVALAITGGMFLAALNVKYRDIKYAIPFGIQLFLFITPVIYPTSFIPEKYRFLLSFNPLTGIIENCRATLVPTRQIDWHAFWVSTLIIGFICVLGSIYFNRAERKFADII